MGEVRKLWIEGPAGRLEALVRAGDNARAAVVLAHPHPLHGGTMQHPVLFHSDRELNRRGLWSLRFNFRGAGESDGTHDEGRSEVEDVGAAVRWLHGLTALPIVLVGYSFGAWCSVRAAPKEPSVAALIGIGIPARSYDFAPAIDKLGRPLAAVHGSEDELASLADIEALLGRARPPGKLYRVEGASHLFAGRAPEAAACVVDAVMWELERTPS